MGALAQLPIPDAITLIRVECVAGGEVIGVDADLVKSEASFFEDAEGGGGIVASQGSLVRGDTCSCHTLTNIGVGVDEDGDVAHGGRDGIVA